MDIDLTPIINAVIALVAAIIARYLIPWIKERTTAEKREDLYAWVEIAVAAAEQLYKASEGPQKKDYVLKFLSSHGFDVDLDDIDMAIEAAVLALHSALYDTKEAGNDGDIG